MIDLCVDIIKIYFSKINFAMGYSTSCQINIALINILSRKIFTSPQHKLPRISQ
jgi:hypothetical protein